MRSTGWPVRKGVCGLRPTWRCEQQEHQPGVAHLSQIYERLFASQRAFDVAKGNLRNGDGVGWRLVTRPQPDDAKPLAIMEIA